jgi:hypothetical protein
MNRKDVKIIQISSEPDIEREDRLTNQAFIENDTPEGFFEENEILKENIDPDFGIQEGETLKYRDQLAKSIKKYLGKKEDGKKENNIREFFGI